MTDEQPAPPRRIRAIDLIEQLQHTIDALTTRTRVPDVSVEFTRNAKGETQIAVKLAAPGGTDSETLQALADTAYSQAVTTYDAACAKYPTASGHVRNDGDK